MIFIFLIIIVFALVLMQPDVYFTLKHKKFWEDRHDKGLSSKNNRHKNRRTESEVQDVL